MTPPSRDLVLVAGGLAVSLVGDEIALVGLTLYAYTAGWGAGGVAALFAAAALALVVTAPLAGRLVDRFDSRAVTSGAGVWQAVGTLGLAALLPADPHPGASGGSRQAFVLVLVFVLNAGQAVAGPAWQALLPEIVAGDGLPRAVSTVQTAGSLGLVAGPAAGGLLVGAAGVRGALLVDAASFLALVGAALLVRARRRPTRAESGPPADARGELPGADGVECADHPVRDDPVLGRLVPGLALMAFVLQVVNVADVFLVRGTLAAGQTAFGLVTALQMAAMALGAVLARRVVEPSRQVRSVVRAAAAIAACLVLAGSAPDLVTFSAVCAALGTANGVLNVAFQAVVLARSPVAQRGRVLAAVTGTVQVGTLTGMLLGGLVASTVPPRIVFVAAGCSGLVVSGVVARAVRRSAPG